MSRARDLWVDVISFDNLYRAFRKCARGKRHLEEVALFERDVERKILEIGEALLSRTWRPGPYRPFVVHDTKPRQVVCAPFEDRVVHMALVEVIEPLLDPTFIDDTFACRLGRGLHAALTRLGRFLRSGRSVYALRGDVSKFFASIDHVRIRSLLARRFDDEGVLWLSGTILDSYRTPPGEAPEFAEDQPATPYDRPRGLPIGNLTSQLWSTLALDPLDQFVKRELGVRRYVRYADDFVILESDKERLHQLEERIRDFLARERLRLDPRKCRIFPVRCGVPFLGFVSFPGYRRLAKSPGLRFRKRIARLRHEFASGKIDTPDISPPIRSWIAHARFGKTWGLRRSLLAHAHFVRRSEEGEKAKRDD